MKSSPLYLEKQAKGAAVFAYAAGVGLGFSQPNAT